MTHPKPRREGAFAIIGKRLQMRSVSINDPAQLKTLREQWHSKSSIEGLLELPRVREIYDALEARLGEAQATRVVHCATTLVNFEGVFNLLQHYGQEFRLDGLQQGAAYLRQLAGNVQAILVLTDVVKPSDLHAMAHALTDDRNDVMRSA